MYVSVKGGTNAGSRVIKKTATTSWFCCGEELAKHWVSCPECGGKRVG